MSTFEVTVDCILRHRSWNEPEMDTGLQLGDSNLPWRARAKLSSPTVIRGNGETAADAMSKLSTLLAEQFGSTGCPGITYQVNLRVVAMGFPKDHGECEPMGGDDA